MLFDILGGALGSMQSGPKPLFRALKLSASLNFEQDDFDPETVRDHLAGASAGDDTAGIFRRALAGWDAEGDEAWTEGTARNSDERRALIYRQLKLADDFVEICERLFPPHRLAPPVVIAGAHKRWYTNEIRQARNFYWSAYKRQLEAEGWADESIAQLDESTTSVVERLADPTSPEAFQSKGLVVGYVQSGKTANFTGVIAKAADAGYKLIIVLAGTLDVLRSQTQRRVDKDMIGQELLDRDYVSDADWDKFLAHGAKPSELGSFDLYRLTGPESDYRQLSRGVDALKFEGVDPTKPLWDRDNLFTAGTRIAIVKKHSKILERLLADLLLLSRNNIGAPLDQVPALIIDDESDQASINANKPAKDGEKQKQAPTNLGIVNLLKILPRAQYVGYTATPFANVFVDPSNEEDIFPKDFLISLPRPEKYMGVSDFYDLEGSPLDEATRPNERDYVRAVKGDDGDPLNLQKAIDSFVLSGAIKLFRRDADLKFRHHTMLIHSSARVADHKELAKAVRETFLRAGYEGGAGLKRLESLLEADFRPVSARREPEMAFPADFAALLPFVAECLSLIGDPSDSVLILNNENKEQTPDFDRQAVWKFLVGGTKLSRGYTVEGLTVSYYRRRAQTADTLMQMGRWFGFRNGYRDLVRLFIGTEEKIDKRGLRKINLYEAFGAVCRDEEMFREELKRYASIEDPRVLPRQIPPLVPSHMLKPTAANKMYNARITFRNFGGQLSESTFAPTEPDVIAENRAAIGRLLAGAAFSTAKLTAKLAGGRNGSLTAKFATISPAAVVALLTDYRYFNPRDPSGKAGSPMLAQLDFLKRTGKSDPEIDDWLFFAPQVSEPRAKDEFAGEEFGVVFRSRPDSGNRLSTYNDPIHRQFAEHITMKVALEEPNPELSALRRPRRGVVIFYPITDTDKPAKPKPPFTPGFTLLFPANGIETPITFGVVKQDEPEALIVAAE
ncbi:Z1 domain-containing protein [Phenylobacterium hankyongense]|nr:Z1 domain-containing protein [Phenylobacterium hankyongense]